MYAVHKLYARRYDLRRTLRRADKLALPAVEAEQSITHLTMRCRKCSAPIRDRHNVTELAIVIAPSAASNVVSSSTRACPTAVHWSG